MSGKKELAQSITRNAADADQALAIAGDLLHAANADGFTHSKVVIRKMQRIKWDLDRESGKREAEDVYEVKIGSSRIERY